MTHFTHIPISFLCMILLLLSKSNPSCGWGWFSKETETNNDKLAIDGRDSTAEFSMEPLKTSRKGAELVQNARRKVEQQNSCWQNAYSDLFAGCSEILAVEEKRSRLAWLLSDCFQKDSGRDSFPYCDFKNSMMGNCLKKLDADSHKIYLEFYLETNSICHQLQTDAFKRQTERLVNELKQTAEAAEIKLENIEEQADQLMQTSNQIHDSLLSIDLRTQQVAQASKNVEDRVNVVLRNTEDIYSQSKEIEEAQLDLKQGQANMKAKFEEGMAMLHDSYNNLGVEIDALKKETVEIEKEIVKVGDEMSLKMKSLQNKADDIGNTAGVSLEKQNQLLDGQSLALEGLQVLTKFQSQALEESRGTLQQLAEFGQKHQEELLQRQKQLEQAHEHLVENSRTILEAQEAFESKQASMFLAIDKLFALHNAILLESRLMKTFLVYSMSIFVLYMFTSTKQTYMVRPRLYIGLCITFLIEVMILRYAETDIERQGWIISLVRSLFVLLAATQLFYAIITYRDYEVLNHQMLLTLIEKVNGMQKDKRLLWDTDIEDDDDDEEWSKWVDSELPEEVDESDDPDYMIPDEIGEKLSAITSCTRKYSLRNRISRL